MPTLIRLIVALLFLVGLGYAGLFALTIFVDPGVKQVTVRIPARDLVVNTLPDTGPAARPLVTSTPAPSAEPLAPVAPGAGQDTPE